MTDAGDRTLIAAGYPLAGLLVLMPLVDVVIQAWPLHPMTPSWRWGLIGYWSNGIAVPVLGFVALLFALVVLEQGHALRWLGRAGLGAGVLAGLGLVLFLYDGIRLRGGSRPDIIPTWNNATFKATVSLLLASAVLLWASKAALEFARHLNPPSDEA